MTLRKVCNFYLLLFLLLKLTFSFVDSLDSFWINSPHSLSLQADLSEKVVVLDFFTYCCINCLHILPDLHRVEHRFSNESLVVIGVHSAKFENEKVEKNAESAVQRYNISHPVVCDDGQLWAAMNISCWPTVLILGPGNQLLFSLVGENTVRQWLAAFCEATLDFFSMNNSESSKPRTISSPKKDTHFLHFPGKISSNASGSKLAISDTGNNRIIVATVEGVVEHIVGEGDAGFADGSFTRARFNSPQGTAWRGESV